MANPAVGAESLVMLVNATVSLSTMYPYGSSRATINGISYLMAALDDILVLLTVALAAVLTGGKTYGAFLRASMRSTSINTASVGLYADLSVVRITLILGAVESIS